MLTALSAAFSHAEADGNEGNSKFTSIRPSLIAGALEGIRSLVALAQFHAEDGAEDRRPEEA